MNPNRTDTMDALSWIGGANTAMGVLTVMLFPFALPILVLTLAFAAPLVLVGVALAIPLLMVRAVRGRARRSSGR
jgi:ABC-type transport system involved in cytochrome bd biosynthesis fused ATPase/permease subunit